MPTTNEADIRKMSRFQQLRDIIAVTLGIGPDRITQTSAQDDFAAWDSLGQINLMVALEAAFGIELQVEDFAKLASVPAILDYLARQGIE